CAWDRSGEVCVTLRSRTLRRWAMPMPAQTWWCVVRAPGPSRRSPPTDCPRSPCPIRMRRRGIRMPTPDCWSQPEQRWLCPTACLGHDPGHLADVDVVVASRAVPELNVEMVTARYQGLPVHHRAQVLGQILPEGFGIAVVGTHGKTTTAAMTAHVLAAGGLDPTALIGADVEGLDGNVRVGRGRYLVAEVDESDGSLLFVRPSAAVVTSLDTTDHRDYYRT